MNTAVYDLEADVADDLGGGRRAGENVDRDLPGLGVGPGAVEELEGLPLESLVPSGIPDNLYGTLDLRLHLSTLGWGLLPSWPWRGKLLWSGQPTAGCMQHASPDAGEEAARSGGTGGQAGSWAKWRGGDGGRRKRRRSRRIETETVTGGVAVRVEAMGLGLEAGGPSAGEAVANAYGTMARCTQELERTCTDGEASSSARNMSLGKPVRIDRQQARQVG